jgi:tetratricopeptide (TPR) repeat protein
MRLLAIGVIVALGFGAAHAQTYRELYDKCKSSSQPPVQRIKDCDAVLERAQPDAKADRAMILLNRSTANLDAKKFDASIKDADDAAALLPRHLDSQNQRCWTRGVANKDIGSGRQACDIALGINNKNAGVWDSSGLIGLRQGAWDKAWLDYNEAYEMDHNMTGSRYGRGLAALALGKTADGEADLKAASGAAAEFKGYGLTPETVKARAAQTPAPATPAN